MNTKHNYVVQHNVSLEAKQYIIPDKTRTQFRTLIQFMNKRTKLNVNHRLF